MRDQGGQVMRGLGIVLAAALVASLGGNLAAHHSAAQFDFGRSVTIKGVVVKFSAINPHMRLVLRVTDTKGTREIDFEGHSTNNMYRAGYRNNMIKVGDTITVYVAPLRDGKDGGYVTAATTSSGVSFGLGSQGRAQEQQKAEGK
jgi:hypothetical protein